MLYLWLKLIHILSSTVLFGTGIGTASVMLYAHLSNKISFIAATTRYVVMADWLFTATSGIIQPLSGLAMVYVAGYRLSSLWIGGAITGYLIAAFCWFPVVYLQIKMRDMAAIANQHNTEINPHYYRYFKYWFFLGWPAFLSLTVVFYLMTFKPDF